MKLCRTADAESTGLFGIAATPSSYIKGILFPKMWGFLTGFGVRSG